MKLYNTIFLKLAFFLLTGLLALVAVISLFDAWLPVITHVDKNELRKNNLREIYWALYMYAMDYENRLPSDDTLQILNNSGYLGGVSRNGRIRPSNQAEAISYDIDLDDYYVSSSFIILDTNVIQPICCELISNRRFLGKYEIDKDKAYVLYNDGTIREMDLDSVVFLPMIQEPETN